MKRSLDIAWAAGIIEGEGTMGLYRSSRTSHRHPTVALSMTDRDIVVRVHHICGFGGSIMDNPERSRFGRKRQYKINATGARAIGIIMTIYQFLGERRRQRAGQILAYWRDTRGLGRYFSWKKLKGTAR